MHALLSETADVTGAMAICRHGLPKLAEIYLELARMYRQRLARQRRANASNAKHSNALTTQIERETRRRELMFLNGLVIGEALRKNAVGWRAPFNQVVFNHIHHDCRSANHKDPVPEFLG